jgi:dienelactone hydrolase
MTTEDAAELRNKKRSQPIWRQIVASLETARSDHRAQRVGQIGFSMVGIGHSGWRKNPDRRARISRPQPPSMRHAPATSPPANLRFSSAWPFVSASNVMRQEQQLRKVGREAEFHHYTSTGHWFFEWDRPDAYDQAAATLAWQRTVAFLNHHLPT